MSTVRLALRQVRFEGRAFWRNPAAAFFTFAFPILFLVIFTAVFDDTATLPTGEEVDISAYYTASILAFAVVTACYTNVAIGVSIARDEGVLKRVRATPVPPVAFLLGKVLHSVAVMVLMVAIVVAFGALAYDVDPPTTSLTAFVVTLVVGAASLCALGLACTTVVPNAEAAPPVVNATIMPLLFLSGVFFPVDDGPAWLRAIGDVFPVKHLLEAVVESFIPPSGNPSGWTWSDVGFVAAWGVAGLAYAARRFSWEPRR